MFELARIRMKRDEPFDLSLIEGGERHCNDAGLARVGEMGGRIVGMRVLADMQLWRILTMTQARGALPTPPVLDYERILILTIELSKRVGCWLPRYQVCQVSKLGVPLSRLRKR